MDEKAKLIRHWVSLVLSPTYLCVIVFVSFGSLILSAIFAGIFLGMENAEVSNLFRTLGGWSLGILVASFTGFRVSKELALREWWRLREYEADPKQAEAKRQLYDLAGDPKGWWLEPDKNRYERIEDQSSKSEHWHSKLRRKEKEQIIDEHRRRLSHFWGNVVELVERGVLESEEVWSAVGDPEIIFILEALEVLLAAKIRGVKYSDLEPWPWGPAKALGWWLESKRDSRASVWKRGMIPVTDTTGRARDEQQGVGLAPDQGHIVEKSD